MSEQQKETPEAPEKPDYLDSRFATVEDQAKAYDEAMRTMHRAQSETNTLKQQMEQERQQFAQIAETWVEQPRQQMDPAMQAAQEALDRGDVTGLLGPLASEVAKQIKPVLDEGFGKITPAMDQSSRNERDMAWTLAGQQVAPLFGDRWGDISTKLSVRFQERPDLIPQVTTLEGFADVLREQANIIESERIVADNNAREAERQAKLSEQTLDNGAARQPTSSPEKQKEWDAVKNTEISGVNAIFGR